MSSMRPAQSAWSRQQQQRRQRPLHAWVAVHNVGSIRVLEKGGFRTVTQENQQHADGVAEVLMPWSEIV